MRKFRATATLRKDGQLCGSIYIEFEERTPEHARTCLRSMAYCYHSTFDMKLTVTDLIEVE